jgi:hypothetical protein
VVTELASNLSKYASNGRILLQVLRRRSGDAGSAGHRLGSRDARRAALPRDGFSTSGTPGTGLGAVRRMATEFDIHSARHGHRRAARIGAHCGRRRNGFSGPRCPRRAPTSWCAATRGGAERDGEIALLVADGLGHGPMAAQAADLAAEVFDAGAFDAPGVFVERAHRALSGSRGAALAAAHWAQRRGALRRCRQHRRVARDVVTEPRHVQSERDGGGCRCARRSSWITSGRNGRSDHAFGRRLEPVVARRLRRADRPASGGRSGRAAARLRPRAATMPPWS